MPVTVKTFTTSGEAAAALSSERDARYLGGGTLVMRALNEGDISISTVVRATDRALTHLDVASSRITIGAGVTFARVLAERDLAPLGDTRLDDAMMRVRPEIFRYRGNATLIYLDGRPASRSDLHGLAANARLIHEA